ncbi:hypothetical protein [Burkholderia contaminans]|uniref:hypothetical protein n=1 Tax=Burkholderia contaminans TaxID=488447 RepID=UPI00158CAAE5|nr:hypothetical protein [Burkholderia contaminans]
MNYLVEMKLLRIKTPQEITQEIDEGIYKGDSHVYEAIFKEGDNVLGRMAELGSSSLEKDSIADIIKNALAKTYNKSIDEIDLDGRLKVKDMTDESFPLITRTYDFITDPTKKVNHKFLDEINEIAASKEFKEEAATHIGLSVEALQNVRKSVEDQFGMSWMKTPLEAPVAPQIEEAPAVAVIQAEPVQVSQAETQSQVFDIPRLDQVEEVPAPVIQAEQVTTPEPQKEPVLEVKNFIDVDIDYENTISRKDSRIGKLAMFDDINKDLDLKPAFARDFFKTFDWNPNKDAGQPYQQAELIHEAMKQMLEQQQSEKTGVSDDNLDGLLKKHRFEKALFSYRLKEFNTSKSFEERIANAETEQQKEALINMRDNMHSDPALLKSSVDRLQDIYKDYKVYELGKEIRPEIVIQRAQVTESDEVKSQRMRENRVDYSDNPKLQAIIDRGQAKAQAQREVKNFRPDPVFELDSMLTLMDMNKSLNSSMKLRPQTVNRMQDTKTAMENPDLHKRLLKMFDERGDTPVVMDMPRDFFSNTKYYEGSHGLDVELASRGQQRQNTTGEYIAYSKENAGEYFRINKKGKQVDSDNMDLITAGNIDKAVSHAFSKMIQTHKQEMAEAPYEQRDSLEAKHTFEYKFCEWQEQNFMKPKEQMNLEGLMEIHGLYQDWMQKSTGLTVNAPFTVEERANEILAKRVQDKQSKQEMSKADRLVASIDPNAQLKDKVHGVEKVKDRVASMRQKLSLKY